MSGHASDCPRYRVRRRRASKKNPAPDNTGYAIAIAAVLVGGLAWWGWKNMSDADKKKSLPG